MASFLDKILDMMGIDDDQYEDEGNDFLKPQEPVGRTAPLRAGSKTSKGRLISFPAAKSDDDPMSKVVLCELSDYDQVPEIVGELRSQFPVVINLRRTQASTAQRFLDILCGVVFALDGKIAKVEDAVYLLTPKGIDISADLDLLSLDPNLDWLNQ